ncbi:MAG: histone deacetylase 11 [Myxococcota bacterium]|jgi:histone deacetylase 11
MTGVCERMSEVEAWKAQRKKGRRMFWLGALAAVLAMMLGLACFVRPPPSPAPSDGTALAGGAVVVYSPGYRVSFFGIERLHPFDINKYDRIAAHLRSEGLVARDGFRVPAEATFEQLAAAHDPDYLRSLADSKALSAALEVKVPFGGAVADKRVLAPFRRAVGGTIEAMRAALISGFAVNLGGGFHHARPEMGHGFCVYNDVAVAIAQIRSDGFDQPILIIDTDAHQGDGDHAFFAEDASVYSFSMHQGNIFPSPKLKGDRDLPLPGGADDATFLGALSGALPELMAAAQPALIVHVAGSDVLVDDPLAGLAMSVDGLVARDLMVIEAAREAGVPLVHLLAGGYGPSSATAQGKSVAAMLRLWGE